MLDQINTSVLVTERIYPISTEDTEKSELGKIRQLTRVEGVYHFRVVTSNESHNRLYTMPALPRLEYHLVNAFTASSPHSGNQASVVLFPAGDPRATDDAFLLRTAKDFGFAETAYLVPIDEQKGRWGLRWFTVLCVRHNSFLSPNLG